MKTLQFLLHLIIFIEVWAPILYSVPKTHVCSVTWEMSLNKRTICATWNLMCHSIPVVNFQPIFLCVEKGPAAEATDAPHHWGLLCNLCDEEKDDQLFFSFFRVMEYRWNENDRGKPKYSGGKPCLSATLSTTNPTWTDSELFFYMTRLFLWSILYL